MSPKDPEVHEEVGRLRISEIQARVLESAFGEERLAFV